MEILTEEALKSMNIDEVCSIRKALNKVLTKLRKDFKRFQCNRVDEKYYRQHLWYSEIVDQTISRKLRTRK